MCVSFFFFFIPVFIFFSVCFCVLFKRDKEIWQQQANLLPKPRLPVDASVDVFFFGPKPYPEPSQSPSAAPSNFWRHRELCRGYARNNKFKGMRKSHRYESLVLIEGLSVKIEYANNSNNNNNDREMATKLARNFHVFFHACHFCFSHCRLIFYKYPN